MLGMLLVGVIMARKVTPVGFGQYAFLAAVGSILVGGATSGLAALGLRETSRGANWSRSDVLRPFIGLSAVGFLLASIAGVLRLGPSGLPVAAASAASSAVVAYVVLRSSMLAGLGKFGRAACAEGVIGSGALVATVAMTAAGALTVTTGILAVAFGAAIGAVVAGAPPVGAATTGTLVRRSVPFTLMGLASSGYARLDVVTLSAVSSFNQIGLYAAAFRFLAPISIITSAFGTVLLTRLVRVADGPARRSVIRRSQWMLVGVVGPIALIGMIAAPRLLRLFFGANYDGAITPARILLASSIPLAVYWPIAHALNAADREWLWTSILGCAAIGSVLLVAVFGGRGGAAGAAAAWCFVETAVMVVLLRIERRYLNASTRAG